MSARQEDGRSRLDGLRWMGIGLGVAAVALAVQQTAIRRRRGGAHDNHTAEVGKAFTINRSADEVARLWSELDPLGDVVEHVRFDPAPGNRGTEIRVRFVPRWFGRRSPARVQELLRQFKQLAETGEIARSTGSRTVRQLGDMPEGGRVEELLVGGAR